VKERPILFSAPMVKALLAGTKTQTRRLLKDTGTAAPVEQPWEHHDGQFFSCATDGTSAIVQAYAEPGDRLWVRETFGCTDLTITDRAREGVHYRATDDWPGNEGVWPWRPSIFMRRWMSRITLEVTGVRVERLQDISEADARAEGISEVPFYPDDGFPLSLGYGFGPDDKKSTLWPTARAAYLAGWDTINEERAPAKSNPWVWVVEFKRVMP